MGTTSKVMAPFASRTFLLRSDCVVFATDADLGQSIDRLVFGGLLSLGVKQ
jgi:hypothetical protein